MSYFNFSLCLLLASWATNAAACDAHSDSLTQLLCHDPILKASIMSLDEGAQSHFQASVENCATPVTGPQWLDYRRCAWRSLDVSPEQETARLAAWEAHLSAYADELDLRAQKLNTKAALFDQVQQLLLRLSPPAEAQ